jgi:hypothetical protein
MLAQFNLKIIGFPFHMSKTGICPDIDIWVFDNFQLARVQQVPRQIYPILILKEGCRFDQMDFQTRISQI